jgi:hypothetical protein
MMQKSTKIDFYCIYSLATIMNILHLPKDILCIIIDQVCPNIEKIRNIIYSCKTLNAIVRQVLKTKKIIRLRYNTFYQARVFHFLKNVDSQPKEIYIIKNLHTSNNYILNLHISKKLNYIFSLFPNTNVIFDSDLIMTINRFSRFDFDVARGANQIFIKNSQILVAGTDIQGIILTDCIDLRYEYFTDQTCINTKDVHTLYINSKDLIYNDLHTKNIIQKYINLANVRKLLIFDNGHEQFPSVANLQAIIYNILAQFPCIDELYLDIKELRDNISDVYAFGRISKLDIKRPGKTLVDRIFESYKEWQRKGYDFGIKSFSLYVNGRKNFTIDLSTT